MDLINAFRDLLLPLILPTIWYFKRDITKSLSGLSLSQEIYGIVAIALIIVLFKNNITSFTKEKYFGIKRFNLRSCIKEQTIFIIDNDFETVMASFTKIAKSKMVQYLIVSTISITLVLVLDYFSVQLSLENPVEKFFIYSMIYFVLRLLFEIKLFWIFVKYLCRILAVVVLGFYGPAVVSYFSNINLFDTIPIETVDFLRLDINSLFDTANRLTFSVLPIYILFGLFLIVVFINRKIMEMIFRIFQQILTNFV